MKTPTGSEHPQVRHARGARSAAGALRHSATRRRNPTLEATGRPTRDAVALDLRALEGATKDR